MSRRRRGPGYKRPGQATVEIYCTRGGAHSEDRIARVTAYPRHDLEPVEVVVKEVEYIGLHDSDDEIRSSYETRGTGTDLWRTHTFRCRICTNDVPLRDDKLGPLVLGTAAIGKRRVELSTLQDRPIS